MCSHPSTRQCLYQNLYTALQKKQGAFPQHPKELQVNTTGLTPAQRCGHIPSALHTDSSGHWLENYSLSDYGGKKKEISHPGLQDFKQGCKLHSSENLTNNEEIIMKLNDPIEIPCCFPAPTESQGMGHPLPGPAGPCVLCKAQGEHQVSASCQGLQPFPPARAAPAAPLAAAGTGDIPNSLVIHHWEMQVTLGIGPRDRTCM